MSDEMNRREGWLPGLAHWGADREALRADGISVDYGRLARAAEAIATRLDRLGLERGDLVAILAPPSVAGVVLFHAMLSRGIVMLPLNARLAEREQRTAIESTQARILIIQGESGDAAESAGRRLVEGLDCGLIAFESRSSLEAIAPRRVTPPSDLAGNRSERDRFPERAALVLQTSGTSGRPKAAILELDQLIASARASAELLGSDSQDRWLLCMPLFHIGGLSILIRSALVGACVVVHERFDAGAVSQALDAEGITRVSLVATMLTRLIEARGERSSPESLELVLLGGGPASSSLLEHALRLGYPVAPTYGLTEAASQVATRPPDRPIEAGDNLAAGLVPLPGVEVRVVNALREAVGEGVPGEIEVRGPIVMSGYLGDRDSTEEAIAEGWLRTGDLGWLDAQGGLGVLDRRADLILSGGENVYPAEVESVLCEAESVVEAGVFGIPDAEFGARPAACVVLRPDTSFDREALLNFCRERMANFKCPVEIDRVDELPRTATGKLLRRALADQRQRGR